jgi:hypothetical protein
MACSKVRSPAPLVSYNLSAAAHSRAVMLGGRVPIFVSPDIATKSTVLLLVQGSGAVRPGIWARALCINDKQVALRCRISVFLEE